MKRYVVGALATLLAQASIGQVVADIDSTKCLANEQRTEFTLRAKRLTSQLLESEEMQQRRSIYREKLLAWKSSLAAHEKCLETLPLRGSLQCQKEAEQLGRAADEKIHAETRLNATGSRADELLMRSLVALRAEYPACPQVTRSTRTYPI